MLSWLTLFGEWLRILVFTDYNNFENEKLVKDHLVMYVLEWLRMNYCFKFSHLQRQKESYQETKTRLAEDLK